MLDPVISQKIQKYGLLKWGCMDYPHLVFSAGIGLIGIGMGLYYGWHDAKKRQKTKYFSSYLVLRPDDPRLKYYTIVAPDDNEDAAY